MRNKHALMIAIAVLFIASPALWFVSGYAHDKQCTAEDENRGRCERLSDGVNNVLGWVMTVSGFLGLAASVASLYCSGLGIYFLVTREGRETANEMFGGVKRSERAERGRAY